MTDPLTAAPPRLPDADARLAGLEARLAEDLALLNYPPANWVPPRRAQGDDRPVSDVVVIGAGMCGLVAGFAMLRAGLSNIRILDRAPAGQEGPWVTYARMETLRSPKQLLGPAYGMPSLTFQAWYRANHGDAAWDALFRIPRPMWMDYLNWYRKALNLPVQNGMDVTRVIPRPDGLFELEIAHGSRPGVLTRRVVMAGGREGLGRPTIPEFARRLPRDRWAHSSDRIDFDALRGKRVIVIGVGASAVDNAAAALEAGAREVRLLARRPVMPTVNKLMGVGSYGLTAGFAAMAPEWRWRIMAYANRQQTPAPSNSTRRVSRHPNAYFHFSAGIAEARAADGEIVLTTRSGRTFHADYMILGTGFTVDVRARPEILEMADEIALWKDRYTPPPDEADEALAAYPWLVEDFSFTERQPGAAPYLARIHCFNFAASLSLGKVSGDIPAISEGAQWLVRGLSAALFKDDVDAHWQALLAYEKPELTGDEWTDADAQATARSA
ncbi:NAD(P)-binding domain-containing protein [Aureimonas frigidaquae]|uniref:FAD-dependent pyridine nucleotide-disulfide oxidoreductase n=1 Tax=Aureimonas frigidaquae TaxID=424757 RepID=A0A0P0Z3F4_9HYPH|nr:NAD(P)/FAD-dependent oxidoreductase [Aureimonas frigidaquae]BAT28620.1 FAD-dependent pyridine nucleotide-disulfide oxidoreductase [Aureimonas frigidaquae]